MVARGVGEADESLELHATRSDNTIAPTAIDAGRRLLKNIIRSRIIPPILHHRELH
jgi:hypothetical protein